MMNLELLLWGSLNGGPQAWRDMALSHALKTLSDMVRSDGSTFHVVDYAAGGAILSRGTLQGYADASTWTRGQAWAIYGYTMLYRYTSDPRMLDAARKVTDFYLKRLGADPIPNWDFDAPSLHKDSSAAAAVAAALFELSGFVSGPDQQRYLQAATNMLDALASPQYLATGTSSQSVLLHGVGNLPAGHAIDVGLAYGDYYFLEAIARRRSIAVAPPPDAGVGDAGQADAGPADAGLPDAGDVSLADAGAPDAAVAPPGSDGGVSDAGSDAAPDAGAIAVPVAPPAPEPQARWRMRQRRRKPVSRFGLAAVHVLDPAEREPHDLTVSKRPSPPAIWWPRMCFLSRVVSLGAKCGGQRAESDPSRSRLGLIACVRDNIIRHLPE